jgi:hypothetical protein
MIEDDLSQVEESATKSTYKLCVGCERCEDKGEKSTPKFVPSSNYHKEEESLKPTKTHYTSNPKPSFNPKRGVKKNTPNPSEEVYISMFCGHAGHMDEYCFRCKRMEKRRFDYARNSYHDEFIDFLPHTYSCASARFFHGPNHRSYGFGLQENSFVPHHFVYGPRPHHGDHPPCRHGMVFLVEGLTLTLTHFELRHLDGPRFPHRGSRPTRSNVEVQKTVKTSSGRMVKCWFPRFYLTNPSIESSTSSRSV